MSTATRHQTTIEADPTVPTVRIVREFDAPPARVFAAFTDKDLYVRWIGPRSLTTEVGEWDATTGGRYTFASYRGGEPIASFYGSFHEVREAQRIVQTFTWDGMPDCVSLETMTFEDVEGRTRLTGVSVLDSFGARDAMLASGMDTGVNEGYEKLDDLLAEQGSAGQGSAEQGFAEQGSGEQRAASSDRPS
ncbi:MAG TPA: SRPBCC family protein [Dermatophilaceae bacterium]|nr:SRPBCC family protein [Dermatophilaceae bacterium]